MCSRKALYYCNALCHVYMCAKQGRAIIKNCLTLNCVIWNSSTLSHVFCYVKLYFMSKINLQFNKKFRVICPSLIQSHIHATYTYMFHIYINSHIVHKLNHFSADVICTYVHTYILCQCTYMHILMKVINLYENRCLPCLPAQSHNFNMNLLSMSRSSCNNALGLKFTCSCLKGLVQTPCLFLRVLDLLDSNVGSGIASERSSH